MISEDKLAQKSMRAIDFITQFLKAMQREGLHVGMVHVLLCLAGGADTCGEMIKGTGMTPKMVTATLGRLVREGYLARSGRMKPYCYHITPKGKTLVRVLMSGCDAQAKTP